MESYKNLEETVWKQEICTRCGACASVCPTQTIVFNNFAPDYNGNCKVITEGVPCGACYNSCGKAENMEPEADYLKLCAAKSSIRLPDIQSGGAITSILISAMESGIIDGVLLMGVDRFTKQPIPQIATTKEQIIMSAGSRYTWGNVLSGLGSAVKSGLKKLAVVGTPCTIQSTRRIMDSHLDVLECYGTHIRFTIGVFCSGIFENIEDTVSKELGISAWQIKKTEIKEGKVHAHLKDDTKELPFSTVKDEVLSGCPKCNDFASNFADISAGNVGSKEGYTTLIIRTDSGNALVTNAVECGNLTLSKDVELSAIEKVAAKKNARV